MILAFIFQDIPVDDVALIQEMKKARAPPNHNTYAYLLNYLCKHGEMERALEYLEEKNEKNLPLTESIVKSLILGYAGCGQIEEGENLLKLLNERNIHWGKGCYVSFVLGCAKNGDVHGTNFFLNKIGSPSDELLLGALQEMHKKHPDKVEFLLNRMPTNVDIFSTKCRRTVKLLVEKGDQRTAWDLVMKCKDMKYKKIILL